MFEGSAGRDDILAPERGGFEGETTRLRRENGILKDQLQRSLKELKAYQQKYPSAYVNIQHKEGDELPPWASSPDIMAPLFEAYDTRVKELESIVHHQSEQLKAQNANIHNIVAENEELRDAQMQHLRSQAGTHNDAFLHPSGPVHAEVLAEMHERIDILMAENALMTEQKVRPCVRWLHCRVCTASYPRTLLSVPPSHLLSTPSSSSSSPSSSRPR